MDQNLKDLYSVREAQLEEKKRRMLEPEIDHLQQIIGDMGQERGFDIIFDEADIAYGARDFDISRDVLKVFEDNPPPGTSPFVE
jgi:Skp family chaperone for outer membrane proteins